jgi:hypothetical protein
MAEDLINLFCEGKSSGFPQPCEHFIRFTKECRLLREQEMKVVFEQGRCDPYKMVAGAVKSNLKLYDHLIQSKDAVSHYIHTLTFEIAERIKARQLKKGWSIYFLKGYINRAVYCEVINRLEEDGIVPKGTCGNCIHLSRSKQYRCEEQSSPYYGKKRNQSDPACKEGFEPYEFENIDDNNLDSVQPPSPTPGLLEEITTILAERGKHEKSQKQQNICERQYRIFCVLKHLLAQGTPRREAIEVIAADLGENIKTIYLDLQKIKDFLEKCDII